MRRVFFVLVAVLFLLSTSFSTALAASSDNVHAKFNPKTTVIIDYPTHKGPTHGKPNNDPPPEEEDPPPPDTSHATGHYELINDTAWGPANPNLVFLLDMRALPVGSEQAVRDAFGSWKGVTAEDLFNETDSTVQPHSVGLGDGVNSVAMRNLGGRALAATFITWNDLNENDEIDDGEPFVEMDVLYNINFKWAIVGSGNEPGGKYFDVEAVGAHEFGHVYGLAHPGTAHPEDEDQTMYRAISSKDIGPRSLEANGDILGGQFLYGAS